MNSAYMLLAGVAIIISVGLLFIFTIDPTEALRDSLNDNITNTTAISWNNTYYAAWYFLPLFITFMALIFIVKESQRHESGIR